MIFERDQNKVMGAIVLIIMDPKRSTIRALSEDVRLAASAQAMREKKMSLMAICFWCVEVVVFSSGGEFPKGGKNGCLAINGFAIKPTSCGVPAVVCNMRACFVVVGKRLDISSIGAPGLVSVAVLRSSFTDSF